MPKRVFKPNTLVMYQGGGYDGNVWEWNLAYYDDAGDFHNIFASGAHGCKTADKLEKRYQAWLAVPHTRINSDEFDLYDLKLRRERRRLSDQSPVDLLIGMVRWFDEEGINVILEPKCDCCGNRFPAGLGHADGLRCVGGIKMAYQRIVCEACYGLGTCPVCEEYVGTCNIEELPDERICVDCLEAKRQREKEDEAAYQARLAAGTALPRQERIEPLPGQQPLFKG